ncbi:MAG TPA: glutamate-5-semialdehyde dehydrogenase [Anaerolinea sp.]|nr:glutamate-5-semialdehyde dehydrogenase [Anaerolinea sp.]
MVDLLEMGKRARLASRKIAMATSEVKNQALLSIAGSVRDAEAQILQANQADLDAAEKNGLAPALLERLMLNHARLTAIVEDLFQVVQLPDPVGEVIEAGALPNGLRYRKQRVPMGVLAIIYESRPNVTLDVAGLAIKSGNCAILRGGSETIRTNRAMVEAIREGLSQSALGLETIQLIEDTDRKLVLDLLQMEDYVDMVIPRGGAGLHEFCRKNSRIPVITGGIGICHLFVDRSADQAASVQVIQNSKVQRPTVCNALDTILVHREIAAEFLPQVVERLAQDGVSFRADPEAISCLENMKDATILPAGPEDFDTEWLSLVLGIRVVGGLEEAIDHINAHSTGHSDGILTNDLKNAEQFTASIDSAAVYVNASTRFTDGAQLGLGAEVAVSTQRMQARGPMGLRELTTYKWVMEGDYHIRAK